MNDTLHLDDVPKGIVLIDTPTVPSLHDVRWHDRKIGQIALVSSHTCDPLYAAFAPSEFNPNHKDKLHFDSLRLAVEWLVEADVSRRREESAREPDPVRMTRIERAERQGASSC